MRAFLVTAVLILTAFSSFEADSEVAIQSRYAQQSQNREATNATLYAALTGLDEVQTDASAGSILEEDSPALLLTAVFMLAWLVGRRNLTLNV